MPIHAIFDLGSRQKSPQLSAARDETQESTHALIGPAFPRVREVTSRGENAR